MRYVWWGSRKNLTFQRRYYWHLVATNGEILAYSNQGYSRRIDCMRAIEMVKGSGTAPVVSRDGEAA